MSMWVFFLSIKLARDEDIQESKGSVLLDLHGKLDMRRDVVEIVVEGIKGYTTWGQTMYHQQLKPTLWFNIEVVEKSRLNIFCKNTNC